MTTTISTDETEQLIESGIPLVDVRTVEEFSDGHIPGAINIPVNVNTPGGMQPNPHFVQVASASFAKDEKFIVACKAGSRSAAAASQLVAAGYSAVLDMTAGFVGKKDAFGATIPGWQAEGREVEVSAKEEQTYLYRAVKAGV